MRYYGGKTKLAKEIAQIINRSKPQIFISLFCGSCAVETLIESKYKLLNDKHEELIEMWRYAQLGYVFPEEISRDFYLYAKENKGEIDKALLGFIGFSSSYCGRWFRGYANNKGDDRNYAKEFRTSLMNRANILKEATFISKDYKDVNIPDNSVVYCDPPYASGEKFAGMDKFDNKEFWEYARERSIKSVVFISEFEAPEDFSSIWEKQRKITTANSGKYQTKTERLFVHQSYRDILKAS